MGRTYLASILGITILGICRLIQRRARASIAIEIPTLKLVVLPGALVLPRLRLVLKADDISGYKGTRTRDLPRGAMWAQYDTGLALPPSTSPSLLALASRIS
jgi:hypothetical protein